MCGTLGETPRNLNKIYSPSVRLKHSGCSQPPSKQVPRRGTQQRTFSEARLFPLPHAARESSLCLGENTKLSLPSPPLPGIHSDSRSGAVATVPGRCRMSCSLHQRDRGSRKGLCFPTCSAGSKHRGRDSGSQEKAKRQNWFGAAFGMNLQSSNEP